MLLVRSDQCVESEASVQCVEFGVSAWSESYACGDLRHILSNGGTDEVSFQKTNREDPRLCRRKTLATQPGHRSRHLCNRTHRGSSTQQIREDTMTVPKKEKLKKLLSYRFRTRYHSQPLGDPLKRKKKRKKKRASKTDNNAPNHQR